MLNKLSRLVLSLCTFTGLQISAEACSTLEEVNLNAYAQHYNHLPDVETANQELQSSPYFHSFLKEAEEIVSRYDLESHVGLRLIHQHFPVGKNQVVTEEYQTVQGTPSLVSWAHNIEEAESQFALPASWIFSTPQEAPIMFEASTDLAVKVGNKMLQNNPEFFSEISKLLDENNLTKQLSVALLKRDSLIAKEEQMYVEAISDDGNRSILQLGAKKDQPENIIRTSWSFRGPKQQGCIVIQCCQPLPGGGHLYLNYHQRT